MYIPYLMILDSIQIRNFLMISIVLSGLAFLINGKTFKSILVYLLFVFLIISNTEIRYHISSFSGI